MVWYGWVGLAGTPSLQIKPPDLVGLSSVAQKQLGGGSVVGQAWLAVGIAACFCFGGRAESERDRETERRKGREHTGQTATQRQDKRDEGDRKWA